MPRIPVSMKLDAGVVAIIDARRTVSRSMWIERAIRAFLAHDEGSARELAGVVRDYRKIDALGAAEVAVLDERAARALTRFEARYLLAT